MMGIGKSTAQNFAYVDTDYILNQIPEYKSAQKKINELAETWQKELDKKYDDIDKMYKAYNVEKVLLNSEQQKQREADIVTKEKEAKKYQQDKFGFEGELFKKREELIKPIQDRVYEAIQKIANKNKLDFIFDKSGDLVMLFSNNRFDKSDEVLEELGITTIRDNKKTNGDTPPSDDDLPPGN
ncbi:MAG: OmpH family outer membrane protein [Bacteroidetes bacterium]|nr:OmpH family outer membrane protein [Bacteroidota bacterium]